MVLGKQQYLKINIGPFLKAGKYISDRSLSLLVGGKAMIKHIKVKDS